MSAIIVVEYIHATCTCHVVVIVVVVIVVVIIVVVLNSFVGGAMILPIMLRYPSCQYPPLRCRFQVDGGPHSSPSHWTTTGRSFNYYACPQLCQHDHGSVLHQNKKNQTLGRTTMTDKDIYEHKSYLFMWGENLPTSLQV